MRGQIIGSGRHRLMQELDEHCRIAVDLDSCCVWVQHHLAHQLHVLSSVPLPHVHAGAISSLGVLPASEAIKSIAATGSHPSTARSETRPTLPFFSLLLTACRYTARAHDPSVLSYHTVTGEPEDDL